MAAKRPRARRIHRKIAAVMRPVPAVHVHYPDGVNVPPRPARRTGAGGHIQHGPAIHQTPGSVFPIPPGWTKPGAPSLFGIIAHHITYTPAMAQLFGGIWNGAQAQFNHSNSTRRRIARITVANRRA